MGIFGPNFDSEVGEADDAYLGARCQNPCVALGCRRHIDFASYAPERIKLLSR